MYYIFPGNKVYVSIQTGVNGQNVIKNVVSDFLKERGIWRDRVIHKNAKILRWKKETVTLMIAVSLYTHKILAISLNKKPSFLIAILDTLGIFNNCRFWGYVASL